MHIIRQKKGFTILEVLASIFIFMVGVAAILTVVLDSMSMSQRTESAYTAFNLAKSHIETLKSISFSDLSNAEETDTAIDETGVPDVNGTYFRTTDVTTNYSGDANLTLVEVSVNYTFKGEVGTTPMEMTTVIYNGG